MKYAIAILLFTTSAANAQLFKRDPQQAYLPPVTQQQMHLPPLEFDHPYNGKLTVEEVTSAQLRARCAAASQCGRLVVRFLAPTAAASFWSMKRRCGLWAGHGR